LAGRSPASSCDWRASRRRSSSAGPTSSRFTPDGFFQTGDLGERDAEGYIRIVGRAKELIISGGYNVYPREVEDVLRGHPTIEEVAVVGEPSSEWGERIVVYAVASGPLGLDALREFVGERLAGYKHPRALYLVDTLPRNALGKVQKHRLVRGTIQPEGPG
jgi:malonyl-CoA/methylmalonyl-CoA synthetase